MWTDHGAPRQTTRWIKILSIYNLEVEHRQGQNHGNADGLSRRSCDNCRHYECSEKNAWTSQTQWKMTVKGTKPVVKTISCVTAVRTAKHLVPKGQDGSTSVSSWLVTLSKTEIREVQLCDPCLGAIIRLKEHSAECQLWETISRESPLFQCYWAQWSTLAVRDGVLFRKWEETRLVGNCLSLTV